MVLLLLGPADEDSAVAVHPGMCRLDDPAPGFPAGSAYLLSDLFAACADVRREVVIRDGVAGILVVVGPVQADALRSLRGRFWSFDRDRVQRVFQEQMVVAVRAVVIEPDRDPRTLREDRTLRPPLARSVGFGPVLGPPSGALVIAPSPDRNDQSIPITSSYSSSP